MGSTVGKSRVSERDKAVLLLKQQRDKLKKYQRKVATSLEKEKGIVKNLINEGKKDRAKLILRKRKYQEEIQIWTVRQLENLEQVVRNLEHEQIGHDVERTAQHMEFAQIEQQMFDGLKSGNEALKRIHDVLKIENVEEILDETREAIEKQKEIDEVLNGAFMKENKEVFTNGGGMKELALSTKSIVFTDCCIRQWRYNMADVLVLHSLAVVCLILGLIFYFIYIC